MGQFFHLESFNSQTLPSESISKQANPEMNHDFSETTAEDLQPPLLGLLIIATTQNLLSKPKRNPARKLQAKQTKSLKKWKFHRRSRFANFMKFSTISSMSFLQTSKQAL